MSDLLPDTNDLLLFQNEGSNKPVQVRLFGKSLWLSQKQIAELFELKVPTVNAHFKNIFDEGELAAESTIRKFLIVQTEGSRSIERLVDHYNLEAILAVGYRVRSNRGIQFRQWATRILDEYLVKGFALDDKRLKEGKNFGQDYFEELLHRVRDIRASERLFYQKITDIYATSIDYDKSAETSRTFFATVQNKLHWAIHGKTAAELIDARADSKQLNMGLTTWKNAPSGAIRKPDVSIAKNYLKPDELNALNRIVTMYLDYAELQATMNKPMTMANWQTKLDGFLQFNEQNILQHSGKITAEFAKEKAELEYEKFKLQEIANGKNEKSDFDRFLDESKLLKGKK
jgi:hypothetical protein